MANRSAKGKPVLRLLPARTRDKHAGDAPIPETEVATDERVKNMDLKTVSHIVVQQDPNLAA